MNIDNHTLQHCSSVAKHHGALQSEIQSLL